MSEKEELIDKIATEIYYEIAGWTYDNTDDLFTEAKKIIPEMKKIIPEITSNYQEKKILNKVLDLWVSDIM